MGALRSPFYRVPGQQPTYNGLLHLRLYFHIDFYGAAERIPGTEAQKGDLVARCSRSSFVRNSFFALVFRAPFYQSADESADCFARRADIISVAAIWRSDVRAVSQLDQTLRRAPPRSAWVKV